MSAGADFIRVCSQAVEDARRAATVLGESHPDVGALLQAAAGVERAELDSRPGGR